MRVMALSDTHGKHELLNLEDFFGIDMIMHSGDISNIGNYLEVERFLKWYHELPVKHKVFILGNHEVEISNDVAFIRKRIAEEYTSLVFLHHEHITLDGIKIFGSPYTPYFHGWAFNVIRKDLEYYWDEIEPDTDLIVTHGPALGFGDLTRNGEHVGCKFLLDKILEIKPQVHQFGHIHEDRGISNARDVIDTLFINASNVQGFPYSIRKPLYYNLTVKNEDRSTTWEYPVI